jgi:hypothetical protein
VGCRWGRYELIMIKSVDGKNKVSRFLSTKRISKQRDKRRKGLEERKRRTEKRQTQKEGTHRAKKSLRVADGDWPESVKTEGGGDETTM